MTPTLSLAADQLSAILVTVERVEVVGRDPPAPHQGEPDPAVADKRFGDEHGRPGDGDEFRTPKYKQAPSLQGIASFGPEPHTRGVWRDGVLVAIL